MFYDQYKDLFLDDTSQPFSKQLNNFKRLKFDNKAERIQNPLSLTGANMVQKPTNFLSNENRSNKNTASRYNLHDLDTGKQNYYYPKTDPVKKNKYMNKNDSINEISSSTVPNVLQFNPQKYSSNIFSKPSEKNSYNNIFGVSIDNTLSYGYKNPKINQERFNPVNQSKKFPKRVNFSDNGRNQLQNDLDAYPFRRDDKQDFNTSRFNDKNENFNQHKMYQKARININDQNQPYNPSTSIQSFKRDFNTKELQDRYPYNRIYDNFQAPTDETEYIKNRNLQNSDDQYDSTKVDQNDFDREPSKNKISYDFYTGTNYEQEGHNSAMTGTKNQSRKIFQVFDRQSNIKTNINKMSNETDLQRFGRDLSDARRLNMPKKDAEQLFKVANQIVPPRVYENFMLKNMGQNERIHNFQEAINRRVEIHFDASR